MAHTWGTEIKLQATGFGTGTPYRARITNHDGTVISAGTFVGTGTATMRCNLNSSVLRSDAASFVVLDPAGTAVVWADLR